MVRRTEWRMSRQLNILCAERRCRLRPDARRTLRHHTARCCVPLNRFRSPARSPTFCDSETGRAHVRPGCTPRARNDTTPDRGAPRRGLRARNYHRCSVRLAELRRLRSAQAPRPPPPALAAALLPPTPRPSRPCGRHRCVCPSQPRGDVPGDGPADTLAAHTGLLGPAAGGAGAPVAWGAQGRERGSMHGLAALPAARKHSPAPSGGTPERHTMLQPTRPAHAVLPPLPLLQLQQAATAATPPPHERWSDPGQSA